jgi:benzoyl-CoA reductase/2-hydroxyglutaryl-CoA dehydratase subunit BcrC/BadD/HgdB
LLDSAWGEFPKITPRRIHYFATEIRNAMSNLQEVLGMEFSDEAFHRSLVGNGQVWGLLGEIGSLMKADPAPLSNVDLALVIWMTMSVERRAIEEGIPAMTTLLEEAKQRVAQGKGKIAKGAPKIYVFSHHFTDPAFMRMIEDAGLCMVAGRMHTLTASDRVKPEYTTFEERRAERQLRFGFYHSSSAQIYKAIEACREWNVAGAILFYHFACRPMNIPMLMMKKSIEEELGIPVLLLEGDFYDTRSYSVEALRTRVETFAEVVRMREATRA